MNATTIDLATARNMVEANMGRVSKLGNWPAWVDPAGSLLGRVPTGYEAKAPGFDAGIACCLDLIPREKQGLSARLHAAWSEADVLLLRRDFASFPLGSGEPDGNTPQASTPGETLDPDAESTWWLYSCAFCDEIGGISGRSFQWQVEDFQADASDPKRRAATAAGALFDMLEGFSVESTLPGCEGVAFANRDGGMQAAYLAGHEIAVHFMDNKYFIGTFRPSLGLEGLAWETGTEPWNGKEMPTSGPVHGSRQFVKAANEAEMVRAVTAARKYLAANS